MSDYKYDIPFPEKQKELLLSLVKQVRKCDVLSMTYLIHKPNDPPYHLSFVVDAENSIETSLSEDPVPGFEVLSLVKITDEHTVFLTPKVFKRADYARKTKVGKWWVRLPDRVKDVMIAFSFTVSLI